MRQRRDDDVDAAAVLQAGVHQIGRRLVDAAADPADDALAMFMTCGVVAEA